MIIVMKKLVMLGAFPAFFFYAGACGNDGDGERRFRYNYGGSGSDHTRDSRSSSGTRAYAEDSEQGSAVCAGFV